MIAAIVEEFRLGLRNLARAKLRSFLTTLGIVFGIASVIAMLAVGAGAEREILRRMRHLGVRNVIVNTVRPPAKARPTGQERPWIGQFGLTFRDLERIRGTIPTVESALPVHFLRRGAWRGSHRVEAKVFAVVPEHFETLNLRPELGRALGDSDEADAAKVCVVRRALLDELGHVEDPLAADLRIGGQYFRVVGVLADEAFDSPTRRALGVDARAREVYVPFRTLLKVFGLTQHWRHAGSEETTRIELDQVVVRARTEDEVLPTARMLRTLLDRFHEEKDFEIVVPLEMLEQRRATQRVFSTVTLLVAAISLLVGGIGIVNVMLATVAERTREIGIRRAVGASRRDVARQFLAETTAIAAVGGAIGCALGLASVFGIEATTGWRTVVTPWAVALALGISASVGILFGLYPALRAARLDPIEALRHE